jgi:cell cycle checkpoint control protein RAD9A
MAILNFTLSPEALSKLHDALVCLGKFSEAVSIEASHDKVGYTSFNCVVVLIQRQLVLTALNTSKSAYASFKLMGNKFFSKYQYKPPRSGPQAKEKFYCKIYNKVSASCSIFASFSHGF